MILSDTDLHKALCTNDLRIIPFPAEQRIQPASIDLRLDSQITLGPKEFALACTREEIWISPSLVGRVEGRSTWGRRGLLVHATAGFIDPGFEGQVTLELFNLSDEPLELKGGDGICQLVIERMSSPAKRPYGSAGLGSKYQGQRGPTEAKDD